MREKRLPPDTPLAIPPERFRQLGYELVDQIADFLGSLPGRRVVPAKGPEELRELQIEESNQVVINGIPLEEYLSRAEVVQTPCCSCACITGQDEAECRAIDYEGDRYEAITPDLLKRVIVGIVESGEGPCCS